MKTLAVTGKPLILSTGMSTTEEVKATVSFLSRRSGVAAQKLAEHTGETARHLDGGILAWEAAGLPIATR